MNKKVELVRVRYSQDGDRAMYRRKGLLFCDRARFTIGHAIYIVIDGEIKRYDHTGQMYEPRMPSGRPYA